MPYHSDSAYGVIIGTVMQCAAMQLLYIKPG